MSVRAERENRCVSLATVGSLDSLELVATPRPQPEKDQVLIEVSAAALNFKEVRAALGMAPFSMEGPSGRGLRFGLECAGTIVQCGSAVRDLSVGDEVVALGESCFSSYVAVPRTHVARIPSGWTFADAATLPIAFLTASYALFRIGRLRRGERVLIHAATGGVGLAAVQLARRQGAEIFATAGTEEKRAALRALGIKHVLDSRSLAFADEVRAHTGGRGVDVVLNSLSGEFIEKSVRALAPYGRFLELGKRDVYAEMPINLRWLEKGISFSVIQFDADSPDFTELFVEALEQCERGELVPLPYTIFAAAEAASAFTFMARAAHTGKVLLAFRDDATMQRRPPAEKSATARAATTGGRAQLLDRTHALSEQDGVAAFAQALASGLPQVVVSTLPIAARRQGKPAPSATPAPGGNAAMATSNQNAGKTPLSGSPGRTFPRPALSNSYVAPRSELEQTLCHIWQSFLGIEPIGVEDDFENLGGDSLLAAPLLAKVRGQLQVRLPTYQLLDTPTIAQLAQAVARQLSTTSATSATLPSTLIELRAPALSAGRPARPILFLVHPAGGHVHIYRDLVAALGENQPVYALQAEGVDGKSEALTTLEALADSYIAAIRVVQPQGPYVLGGASLGGAIVYEMARRLSEQGQSVRFVALFDTPGPGRLPKMFQDDAEIFAYMMILDGVAITADELRRLSPDEQLQRYYSHSNLIKQVLPELARDQLRAFLHVWRVHARALHAYAPRPSPVPMLFFLAREKDAFNSTSPDRAWVELARGGLEVHEVPGNHITMNHAPHVEAIAERLRQRLSAV